MRHFSSPSLPPWPSTQGLGLTSTRKSDLLNSMHSLRSLWGLVDITVFRLFPALTDPFPSHCRGWETKPFLVLPPISTFSSAGHHCSKTTSSNHKLKMGAPEEEAPRPPSDITVFGANCTLHGLSHIFLPGGVTIRRLLWAAAFSSSLSIFLLQVADRVIEYYQYPHVTILDEMDSPVMYFPAITLCNYNSFRKSQIRRNDIFWMAGLLGVEQADFDDFMAAIGQPSDNTKFFPSKTFNMLEFVQRTSHNIEEMLLDCKYRGKDCGPENFTTVSMASSVKTKITYSLENFKSEIWTECRSLWQQCQQLWAV